MVLYQRVTISERRRRDQASCPGYERKTDGALEPCHATEEKGEFNVEGINITFFPLHGRAGGSGGRSGGL